MIFNFRDPFASGSCLRCSLSSQWVSVRACKMVLVNHPQVGPQPNAFNSIVAKSMFPPISEKSLILGLNTRDFMEFHGMIKTSTKANFNLAMFKPTKISFVFSLHLSPFVTPRASDWHWLLYKLDEMIYFQQISGIFAPLPCLVLV